MPETIAEQWFRRVWKELDGQAIDELFAADGVAYGIYGEEIRGPAAFREFHHLFATVFSDIDIEVVEHIQDGDRVAIRCRAAMNLAATEQPVQFDGTGFLSLRDGQIVEAWNCWDFLAMLERMKLMPERSFELAIMGKLNPHQQVETHPA